MTTSAIFGSCRSAIVSFHSRQTDRQTDSSLSVSANRFVTIQRVKCCLSLHFNGHFPDGSGLASTRMSPFWILLELRMMEVVVTTGAIRRAKLKSKHPPSTNQHRVFLQAGCPSCCPTNSVRALTVGKRGGEDN